MTRRTTRRHLGRGCQCTRCLLRQRHRRLLERLADWLFNPRCPWCRARTPHLEAHFHIDHANRPGGRP